MVRKESFLLRKIIREFHLNGILFFSLENIRYLCGFTGSDGVLWVGEEEQVFLSDFRYEEQARQEVQNAERRTYKQKVEGLAQFLRARSVRRVGFESPAISFENYQRLRAKLPRVGFIPLNREIQRLRACKSSEELERIRRAAQIASKSFQDIESRIRPGVSERDLADWLEWRMKRRGGEGPAFPTIVASGDRAALPHGRASQKKVQKGEIVIVDFGTRFQGYHSDETQTLILGRPSLEQRRIYDTVRKAQERALRTIRPGAKVREIDGAARGVIERAGYGQFFRHGTGHGVGLAVHEEPVLSPRSQGRIEEGMVFTVEPGIYIPGRGGVRLEDLVFVTASGFERLNGLSKELSDNIRLSPGEAKVLRSKA